MLLPLHDSDSTTSILHVEDFDLVVYEMNGAGERSRTLDLLITSQLLYQLSYTGRSRWWRMTGSNRRPPACKAGALPAELILHVVDISATSVIVPCKGQKINRYILEGSNCFPI
jgi:hypothetical protein